MIVYLGIFRAVVESVLLYGSSAWTITKRLENNLMEHTHACYVQSQSYTGVLIPVKSVYMVT